MNQVISEMKSGRHLFVYNLLGMLMLWGFLSGCIRNEFQVEAEMAKDISHTYNISYYASDKHGGLEIQTALNLTSGQGSLKGVTKNPTVGWIFYGNSPLPAAIFYAERGDKVAISGDDISPLKWVIKGNKINEQLTEWRLANAAQITRMRDSYASPDAAASMDAARQLNKRIAEFVRKNPDSGASALIMGAFFNAVANPELEAELWQILEKSEVMAKFSPLLARQDCDFSTSPVAFPKKLKKQDLILQSHSNNIDTLHLAAGKYPVVMLFWQTYDENRRERLDSIRRLALLRKDSLQVMIADVALGGDSISWNYMVRRDSIYHTLRAWAISGFADPQLMDLGVDGTPQWIVAGSKGEILYRGDNDGEAMKIARGLIKGK